MVTKKEFELFRLFKSGKATSKIIAVGRTKTIVRKQVKGKKNVFLSTGPVYLRKGSKAVRGVAAYQVKIKR